MEHSARPSLPSKIQFLNSSKNKSKCRMTDNIYGSLINGWTVDGSHHVNLHNRTVFFIVKFYFFHCVLSVFFFPLCFECVAMLS